MMFKTLKRSFFQGTEPAGQAAADQVSDHADPGAPIEARVTGVFHRAADRQECSARPQDAQRRRLYVEPTNAVEDAIDTNALALQHIGERGSFIIDDAVGAEGGDEFGVSRAAHTGDMSALQLEELRDEAADAARCRQHRRRASPQPLSALLPGEYS